MTGEKIRAGSVSAECRFRGYDASSLTRSLRSYRETAAGVTSLRMKEERIALESGREEKDAELPFFHRLRPLTSITKSDAQISGGETRCGLKIPGVSP